MFGWLKNRLAKKGASLGTLSNGNKSNAPQPNPQLSSFGNAASLNNANANNNLKKNLRIYINNFNKRNQVSRNANNVPMNKNLAKSLKKWLGKRRPAAAAAAANAVLAAGGNTTQAAKAAVVAGNATIPGNNPISVGTQITNILAANGTSPNLALAAGASVAGALAPPGIPTTTAIVHTAGNGAIHLANSNTTPPVNVGNTAKAAALAAGASPTASKNAGKLAAAGTWANKYKTMNISNLLEAVKNVSNINRSALRAAILAKKVAWRGGNQTKQKLGNALSKLANKKTKTNSIYDSGLVN
jgi:hypothetical protein